MPKLENARREKFAVLMASGYSQRLAHQTAYPNASPSYSSWRGWKLSHEPEVEARIAELRAQNGTDEPVLSPKAYLARLKETIEGKYDVVNLAYIALKFKAIAENAEKDADRIAALSGLSRIGEIQEGRKAKASQELGKLIARRTRGQEEGRGLVQMVVYQPGGTVRAESRPTVTGEDGPLRIGVETPPTQVPRKSETIPADADDGLDDGFAPAPATAFFPESELKGDGPEGWPLSDPLGVGIG